MKIKRLIEIILIESNGIYELKSLTKKIKRFYSVNSKTIQRITNKMGYSQLDKHGYKNKDWGVFGRSK